MSITIRFNFANYPGSADDAADQAAVLVRMAQAGPLGCRVEVVRNGLGDGIADALAEKVGEVFKVVE